MLKLSMRRTLPDGTVRRYAILGLTSSNLSRLIDGELMFADLSVLGGADEIIWLYGLDSKHLVERFRENGLPVDEDLERQIVEGFARLEEKRKAKAAPETPN